MAKRTGILCGECGHTVEHHCRAPGVHCSHKDGVGPARCTCTGFKTVNEVYLAQELEARTKNPSVEGFEAGALWTREKIKAKITERTAQMRQATPQAVQREVHGLINATLNAGANLLDGILIDVEPEIMKELRVRRSKA